jgi:hypothetical protein
MRSIFALLILVFSVGLFASQETQMTEYQKRIMDRRSSEARILWTAMKSSGFTETTVAALDFVYFSNSESEANDLIEQLSENYTLEFAPANDPDYVLVKGTTRPYGNEFTYDQWIGWVEFMVKVGFSHNSVFSTWSVYSPKTNDTWSSESIEVE